MFPAITTFLTEAPLLHVRVPDPNIMSLLGSTLEAYGISLPLDAEAAVTLEALTRLFGYTVAGATFTTR